jgi:Fe2+ or Zn2+ uptake regulation protein
MQECHPDVPLNSSEVVLAQDAIQAVRVLLDLKLTGNQRLVLSKLEQQQGNMTHTVMVISKELELSEPTVRRTLQLCRSLGLISCGDKDSKGISVRLTPLGQKVLETNGGDAEKQPPDQS